VATKTRNRPPTRRLAQFPKQKTTPRRLGRLLWPLLIIIVAAGAFLVAREQAQGPSKDAAVPATGLPQTPDYHALLVDPADPDHIFLGMHAGLHESSDGDRSWTQAGLAGQDAMNLAHAPDRALDTARS